MPTTIQTLMADLNLRSGHEMTPKSTGAQSPADRSELIAQLTCRGIHEFYNPAAPADGWHPPLILFTALARQLAAGRYTVWVGRQCWPPWQFLHGLDAGRRPHAVAALYLDPLSDDQWVDAVTQAARCHAVALVVTAVVGDISPAVGRRLQLAVETQQAMIFISRPTLKSTGHCWAATRWHVQPSLSTAGHPQWDIKLNAARGHSTGTRHWSASWQYEVLHGAGALRISSRVGDRTDTPPIGAAIGAKAR